MNTPTLLQRTAAVTDRIAETYVRVADGINNASGWVSRMLVLVLIPVGFLNVFLRYVGQYVETQLVNNTWIEAQWYLYGVIFLLMFPHLLLHDGNVRVDFWYAERTDRVKGWIDLVGHHGRPGPVHDSRSVGVLETGAGSPWSTGRSLPIPAVWPGAPSNS